MKNDWKKVEGRRENRNMWRHSKGVGENTYGEYFFIHYWVFPIRYSQRIMNIEQGMMNVEMAFAPSSKSASSWLGMVQYQRPTPQGGVLGFISKMKTKMWRWMLEESCDVPSGHELLCQALDNILSH